MTRELIISHDKEKDRYPLTSLEESSLRKWEGRDYLDSYPSIQTRLCRVNWRPRYIIFLYTTAPPLTPNNVSLMIWARNDGTQGEICSNFLYQVVPPCSISLTLLSLIGKTEATYPMRQCKVQTTSLKLNSFKISCYGFLRKFQLLIEKLFKL